MGYKEPDPVSQEVVEAGKMNADLQESDRQSRQGAAIGLRIAGASYSEIARTLEYSSAAKAREAVERGLAALGGEDDREQLRFIEARRLERILRGLWKKATDDEHGEHLAAARTALAVIDRHAKLYGLDAPTEMVVYNPTQTEIDAWLAQQAQQLRGATPDEVDIISGEVISGGEGIED